MAGSPDLLARRRAGTLDFGPRTPRLVALCGDLLTPMNAGTPEAAAAEVARQAAAGADLVKAALITADLLPAAQAEAARHGIAVLGHLPAGVDVQAASRAGFRSIEHVVGRIVAKAVVNPSLRTSAASLTATRHALDTCLTRILDEEGSACSRAPTRWGRRGWCRARRCTTGSTCWPRPA